jgi:hypothetical protein
MELHAMDDGKLFIISLLLLALMVAMFGHIDIIRIVEDTLCGPLGGSMQQFIGAFCSVI